MALVPDSIGCLKELKVLYLSDNQLTSLPAAMGTLRQLSYLGATHNHLHEFPETVTELANFAGTPPL